MDPSLHILQNKCRLLEYFNYTQREFEAKKIARTYTNIQRPDESTTMSARVHQTHTSHFIFSVARAAACCYSNLLFQADFRINSVIACIFACESMNNWNESTKFSLAKLASADVWTAKIILRICLGIGSVRKLWVNSRRKNFSQWHLNTIIALLHLTGDNLSTQDKRQLIAFQVW